MFDNVTFKTANCQDLERGLRQVLRVGDQDVEVALLCRGTTSHTVGERRRLVSAFEVDACLGD